MRRQAAIWTAAGTAAGTGVPRKTCIGAGQQGDAVVIDYAKILTELEEERAALPVRIRRHDPGVLYAGASQGH